MGKMANYMSFPIVSCYRVIYSSIPPSQSRAIYSFVPDIIAIVNYIFVKKKKNVTLLNVIEIK